MARVLTPGVSLHFVEHGLAPDPDVVRWQRRGNRLNKAVFGCLLDNDVDALLAASPLTVTARSAGYEKAAGYMDEGRATA